MASELRENQKSYVKGAVLAPKCLEEKVSVLLLVIIFFISVRELPGWEAVILHVLTSYR